ncbi:Uncharacterised protein [Segatella copri]|nr:Uncharacterised protein [Segatella copri]
MRAEARFAASIIRSNSIKLSELGNVLCTRKTSRPRIDSSKDTPNSPSENLVTTKLPSGQPKLAQIFSARYLELVPENTKKEFLSLISISVYVY